VARNRQIPISAHPGTPTSSPNDSILPSANDLVSPAHANDGAIFAESWKPGAENFGTLSHPTSVRRSTLPHALRLPISGSQPVSVPATPNLPMQPFSKTPDGSQSQWHALVSRGAENAELLRADNAVHALVAAGVPTEFRPQLWLMLSGANEERRRWPREYYSNLIALHREKGSPYDDEIRRDLARTLPGVDLFHPRKQDGAVEIDVAHPYPLKLDGNGGLSRLNRVLCAYSLRNRSVGYCQGLNMLAGTLLTLFLSSDTSGAEAEENSFWILCTLVESRLGYFSKSMAGLEVDQLVLGSLVSYYLPRLADHLRLLEISLASFTVSWLVCLFVEAPLTVKPGGDMRDIYEVWDYLFLRGDEFLFGFGLALLRTKETEICRRKDQGELLEFVLHSGFKAKSTGDKGGMNVHSLLHEELPPVGSLARQIAPLRESHRNTVIAKSRVLSVSAAQRLAIQLKNYFPASAFSGGGAAASTAALDANASGPPPTSSSVTVVSHHAISEIQNLWRIFLSPSPWSILLHGSITSLVAFHDSFVVHVFPERIRNKWREQGLLSGIVARLWATIDADQTGEIDFETFLGAVGGFSGFGLAGVAIGVGTSTGHSGNIQQGANSASGMMGAAAFIDASVGSSVSSGVGKAHLGSAPSPPSAASIAAAAAASLSPAEAAAAEEERLRFAFRFYDIDGDGKISIKDMKAVFLMFQKCYNGTEMPLGYSQDVSLQSASTSPNSDLHSLSPAPPPTPPLPGSRTADAEEVADLFVQMLFQKAAEVQHAATAKKSKETSAGKNSTPGASNGASDTSIAISLALRSLQENGLPYSLFRKIIALHPFTQIMFSLQVKESAGLSRPTGSSWARSNKSYLSTDSDAGAHGNATKQKDAFVPTLVAPVPLSTRASNALTGGLTSLTPSISQSASSSAPGLTRRGSWSFTVVAPQQSSRKGSVSLAAGTPGAGAGNNGAASIALQQAQQQSTTGGGDKD
jgi:hypothetical protein